MTTEAETPDLYVHVGQRVKSRRRALNLSQAQLAEFIGVSYQQLQKYENGSSQLSLGRILRLAQALNVSANFFYDGAPSESIGTPIKTDMINRNRSRPLNLLLVEDSPADAILFERASQAYKTDLSIFCLHDPELVMDYFRTHQTKYGQGAPDLVVLDLNLPKMTGVQLLKELKNNSQTQSTPVVVLTHSISRREMTEVYRIGAAGFLQKAMQFETYKESIEIMLQYWLKAVALPLV